MTRSLTAPLLATIALIGCSNKADDCHWTRTCGEFETGGATSVADSTGGKVGTGGKMGTGGVVATGGNQATGGVIATGGMLGTGGVIATGGIPATGGAPTCSPACQGEKPVCFLDALTCVQCTSEEHCATIVGKAHCDTSKKACVECANETQCANNLAKPHCDATKNACVQCSADAQCSGSSPFCDLTKNTCVECLDNEDCHSPGASSCVAGKCSPCATNNDCSHINGKGVCKPTLEPDAGAETGVCVECTGTDYAACSDGDAGARHVCDTLTSTCTEYVEHTAGLCQPCVSDAQCQTGELCIEQVFNGKSAGHFCLYQQGAAGAPADCTTARPYVKPLNAASIDGTSATVCSLRVSTCTALNQFSQTPCASTANTPDDALCGVAPGGDSKCVPYGTTQFRCTVACLSDDDCRAGVTCNIGVNPPICNLL